MQRALRYIFLCWELFPIGLYLCISYQKSVVEKIFIHEIRQLAISYKTSLAFIMNEPYLARMEKVTKQYDAVALLSGGLDSLLAVKVIQDQGLTVKGLHFVTPFFGKPHKIRHWEKIYGIEIDAVNVSEEYVRMMVERPAHGFGKTLNPCVDCKILMLRKAHEMMESYGAQFIITGEVLGQRPMSQRKDTLNVIKRDADVQSVLLRPLCALCQPETEMEKSGLVQRDKLLGISGRGRKEQLKLADHYGFTEIPSPGGGCKLTERENGRRYWPVLKYSPTPSVADFKLSNIGRQYWSGEHWMTVGRNQMDNDSLLKVKLDSDLVFKVVDFPGPISIGRQFAGKEWTEETIADAAMWAASYSPKAKKAGVPVEVSVVTGSEENRTERTVTVTPERKTPMAWAEWLWPDAKEEIRDEARARAK